jgi:hypothetical protein
MMALAFPFAFDSSGNLLPACLFSAAKNKLCTGISLTGGNPHPCAMRVLFATVALSFKGKISEHPRPSRQDVSSRLEEEFLKG